MATTTIDYTLESEVQTALINEELDTQTELLELIRNNTNELNKIKDLIKQTNHILNKIYQ